MIYQIENFESIILLNDGGHFKPISLPIEAQVSPIKDAIINDFNSVAISKYIAI